MATDVILILVIFILGFLGLFWILNKKLSELRQNREGDQLIAELLKASQEGIATTNKNITDTLAQNTRDINTRLDRAAKVIGDLQREAGQFSEVSRSMRDLQEFLQNPKLRGNIGEEVLRDLLNQTFPKSAVFLQYEFKSGNKVDAALKTDAGLLPIDSKFPMGNFQKMMGEETAAERERAKREFARDIRHHIDAISEKYILPEEGTVDFAIMYVPAEAVYYEIVNLVPVMEYARNKRVYPVSPTTLYAHLQIILMSFEGKQIEQQARSVLSAIRSIQKDYEKTGDILGLLGKHLNNAYNAMSNLTSVFGQLGQKIASTQILGKETVDETRELEEEKPSSLTS